jgi:hypothetical protein
MGDIEGPLAQDIRQHTGFAFPQEAQAYAFAVDTTTIDLLPQASQQAPLSSDTKQDHRDSGQEIEELEKQQQDSEDEEELAYLRQETELLRQERKTWQDEGQQASACRPCDTKLRKKELDWQNYSKQPIPFINKNKYKTLHSNNQSSKRISISSSRKSS